MYKVIQLNEEAKISKQACLILTAIYLLASLLQGHGQPTSLRLLLFHFRVFAEKNPQFTSSRTRAGVLGTACDRGKILGDPLRFTPIPAMQENPQNISYKMLSMSRSWACTHLSPCLWLLVTNQELPALLQPPELPWCSWTVLLLAWCFGLFLSQTQSDLFGRLRFGAILDSQQKWEEGTEVSHRHPAPHMCKLPHYQHLSKEGYVCSTGGTDIDTS